MTNFMDTLSSTATSMASSGWTVAGYALAVFVVVYGITVLIRVFRNVR